MSKPSQLDFRTTTTLNFNVRWQNNTKTKVFQINVQINTVVAFVGTKKSHVTCQKLHIYIYITVGEVMTTK